MYVCLRVVNGYRATCVNFEVQFYQIVGSYFDKLKKERVCINEGVGPADV